MAVIIEEIFDDDNSKINPGSDHGSQGEDSEGNDNERPEQVLENISDVEDDWVHVEEPEDDEGEVKPLEEVEEERNPHIHFDHDEDPDDDAEEETLTLEEREEMMRQAEVWKKEGNVLYVSGDYERAAEMYSKSLETAPLAGGRRDQLTKQDQVSKVEDASYTGDNDTRRKIAMLRVENRKNRSVYFANRAACFLALNEYESAASDCSDAIDLDPTYLKAYMRRAMAFEQLEEYDRGLDDAQHILKSIDSANGFAKAYVARITPIAEKKREELKDEMVSKLKELGNSLLGNFGLSLDNFKAEQDPDTGSYSIKFSQ